MSELKAKRKIVTRVIEDLYSDYIFEKHSEEFGNDKDKYVEMICDGFAWEEFKEWLEEGI